MKARFSLTAILAALAILAPTLSGFSQDSSKNPIVLKRVRSVKPLTARQVTSSPTVTSATIELSGESMVQWNRGRPGRAKGARMVFDSAEALGYEANIEAQQNEFVARASLLSPNLRVVTHLRKLANAVSIEAPASELARLAALPGVERVEMNRAYHINLDTSVPLIRAPQLWERLGGESAGEGIKIAIIDSGIDIRNPLFSDSGFTAPPGFPRGVAANTNNKVIVAKAFAPDSNPSPHDQNGHGTNVAGIAAGNLNTPTPFAPISGVAPRAFLGNYRVTNAEGESRSDLLARALEEATADGFDVVNMSLGAPARSELTFLDLAVESAVAAGMIVVVSAGNSGEEGETTITSPGIAPSAITVGATTNFSVIGSTASVDDPAAPRSIRDILVIEGDGFSEPIESIAGPLQLADVRSLDGNRRGCNPLAGGSLTGKIALIERGGAEGCTFSQKVNNAEAAGAVGVIIFNKDVSESEEDDGGDVFIGMQVSDTRIPSVFTARSTGLALRNWLAAHSETSIRLRPDEPIEVHETFSSRGPTPLEILKPDLVAPGSPVFSGAIPERNPDGVSDPSGFALAAGTSQASPHVAGTAALLKQLHPTWSPTQIKSALISSADDEIYSFDFPLARVLDMGAGRIDLEAAGNVAATFSPASISFGVRKLKKNDVTVSADLTITSVTEGRNTFQIGVEQFDPGDGVSLTLSTPSVTLDQGQSATITVTLNAIRGAERRHYTGFLLINGPQGQALHVPYWIKLVKKKKG